MNHSTIKKHRLAQALLCAILPLAASSAFADTPVYTLADLITKQGSITIGDKTFSAFSYHSEGFYNDATGAVWNALDQAAHISVHGEVVNGNYGLDFTGPWHAHPGDTASAQLTYTVTVNDKNQYLSDFHLDGDVLVAGAGGQAVVRESVSDPSHTLIPTDPAGPLEVSQYQPGSSTWNDFAATLKPFQPHVAIVESTILASAAIQPQSNASVLHFQQQFSQAPVPEPSTYLLSISGLMAVGLMRRRGVRTTRI
jgi:hypothetical protein